MRKENWEGTLVDFMNERAARPFVWGENDCATFATDWVEVCTGEKVFTYTHTTEIGALRKITAEGGLSNAVTTRLGSPMQYPGMAERGDVALVMMNGRQSLGIVEGVHVIGPGEDGMLMVSRTDIIEAWKVG